MSPSARRSAHSELRRLARALASSTSGQKRAASSARAWVPGLIASQASSAHSRRLAGVSMAAPSSFSPMGPITRTVNIAGGA